VLSEYRTQAESQYIQLTTGSIFIFVVTLWLKGADGAGGGGGLSDTEMSS